VPPDGYLAIVTPRSRPPRHAANEPLQIAHMGFVGGGDAGVRKFVSDDAEQIALHRRWIKPDRPLFVMAKPVELFLVRGPLNADAPPLAVELEAHRRSGFLAPARPCGGLFHGRR
jgi:hypothetical protein